MAGWDEHTGGGERPLVTEHSNLDRMVDLIDAELGSIASAEKRGGWSAWVQAAALAGICWLALDVWEQLELPLTATASVVLAGLVILDAMESILHALRAHGQPPRGLFHEGRFFSGSRLGTAALSVRGAIGVALALVARDAGLRGPGAAVVIGYFSLVCLAGLATLLATWSKWPLPIDYPDRARVIRLLPPGLALVAASWALAVLAPAFSFLEPGMALDPFRLAVLTTAMFFLLPRLAVAMEHPVLRTRLIDLRRRLVLGDTLEGDAKTELRILLMGQRASRFIQRDVARFLDAIQATEVGLEKAERLQEDVDKKLHEADSTSRERARELLRELRTLAATQMDLMKELDLPTTSAMNALTQIGRKMSWVGLAGDGALDAEVHQTLEAMHELAGELRERSGNLYDASTRTLTRTEEWFSRVNGKDPT